MDQLIAEIEAYAAAVGVKPGTVVKNATGHGNNVFPRWKAGKAACTLPTADRIRAYIQENPAHAPAPADDPAAGRAHGEGAAA